MQSWNEYKKGDTQSTENKQPSTAYNHTLKWRSRKLTKQLLTHDFKSSFLFLFQSYLAFLFLFQSYLAACMYQGFSVVHLCHDFLCLLSCLSSEDSACAKASLCLLLQDSWSLAACAIATSVLSFFLVDSNQCYSTPLLRSCRQ